MFNHIAYNLGVHNLLSKFEIWVELINGYDNFKVDFSNETFLVVIKHSVIEDLFRSCPIDYKTRLSSLNMDKKPYILAFILLFTFLIIFFAIPTQEEAPKETQLENRGKLSHPKVFISKIQRLSQEFVHYEYHWHDTKIRKWDDVIGNGVCQDLFNVAMYDYDGGDCCLIPMPIKSIGYCERCICHKRIENCPFPYLMSEGFCHEVNNNENCLWDGGDCDDPEPVWSPPPTYCGFPMRLGLGDGICDDSANEPWCYYDLGDCCKKDAIFDLCQECRCQVKFEPDGICVEPSLVGNGNCDPFLNNEGCLFDGGDCY